MHFLLHVGKMIGSFQYPKVVSFFFLKRFLSFLHFQWPSRLSLPSVYLIFPSSLTTTSRRGFPSKKIPQRKKFNPAPGKKRICYRRSHRQSANQRSRQGSIQQERDTALPKESLALLPPGRCFLAGVPATPTQRTIIFQKIHLDIWLTFQSLEKFSSKCVLWRCLSTA